MQEPDNVAKFVRDFRTKVEPKEIQWPFDPLSYPLYAMIAVTFVIEVIWIHATDFTVDAGVLVQSFYLLIWIAAAGLLSRRYGFPRLACLLEAFSLPLIAGALLSVATVLLASISLPFADAALDRADKALGFDYMALFRLYQTHPWLVTASRFAYKSFHFQLPLIALALFIGHNRLRGWTFITAFVLAGFICALIFPLFPAEGPYVLYGIKDGDLPGSYIKFPWLTGPLIEGIRNGEIRNVVTAMSGLVSFPSFHTAGGIIFAWACLPLMRVRLPLFVLNAAMIFSTIIRGDHYLIDLIGGAAVAVVSIWLARWLLGHSKYDEALLGVDRDQSRFWHSMVSARASIVAACLQLRQSTLSE